jgi:hypothetical protein
VKTFEVTAPDGKTYEVTGPDGSTAEQALAQVQAQLSGAKAEKPRGTAFAMKPGEAGFGAPGVPAGFSLPPVMGATDEEMLDELSRTGELKYGDSLPYGAAKVGASIAGYAGGGAAGATALEGMVRQTALVHNLDKAVKAGAITEDRAWEIFAKEMVAGSTEDFAWNAAIPFLGALAQRTPGLRPLIQKFAQKIGSKIHRTPEGKIIPADEVRQREMKVARLQAQTPTPAAKQAVGDLAARTDDYLPTPGQVTGEAGFGERVGRAADPDQFAKQETALQDAAEGMREKALGVTLDPAAPSLRGDIGATIQGVAEAAEKAMKTRLRPTFQAADNLGVKVDFSGVVARAKAALAADAKVPGGRLAPQEREAISTLVADLTKRQQNARFVGPPKVSPEAALDFISRQKEKLRSVTADWKPSAFYDTIVNGFVKDADGAYSAAATMAGKPEVAIALKGARDQYREMMETVYEDAVKQALKTNKPEDIGRFFWQSGNVSEPKQLQKLLALAQREGAITGAGAWELNRKMTQGFLQEAVSNIDSAARWSTTLREKPGLRDTWNTLTSAPGGKELRAAMEVLEEAAKIATRGSAPVNVGGVPIKRAASGGLGVSYVTGALHPGMLATGAAIVPMTRMIGTAYAQGNKGILNMIMRSLRASSAGTAAGAKAAQAAWPELQRFAAENGIDLSAGGPSGASEPDPTAQ